jgi:O-acetyl-ADP-ribose deacetylase (regulator of RNase III)
MQRMAEIRLYKGSITDVEADALVNAANNALWMGSGVAGAIKRAGGVEIEREAMALGPIEVGGAVATGAGRLKARHVIHAAAMGQDLTTDEDKVRRATRSAFAVARGLGVQSIAFPALGTGVGGFPLRQCARVMLEEAVAELQVEGGPRTVIFALYGEEAYEAFRRELASRQLPPGIEARF